MSSLLHLWFLLFKWLFFPFVLASTWRMTWCASLTVRLMTSWTVWLKSRPLWSPPLYPQSSHHLCQTRRGTNSGSSTHPGSVLVFFFVLLLSGKKWLMRLFFAQAFSTSSWPRQAVCQSQVSSGVSRLVDLKEGSLQWSSSVSARLFTDIRESDLLLPVFPPVSCLRSTTSGLSTTCLSPCSFSSSSAPSWLISLMKEGKWRPKLTFIKRK